MNERAHLSIGEVLALLREEFPDITISKIRFLESQGLLDPERTPSGYRKFYEDDVEQLRWILRQQREHFLPLKVIKGRLLEREGNDGDGSLELGYPAQEVLPGTRDPIGDRPPRLIADRERAEASEPPVASAETAASAEPAATAAAHVGPSVDGSPPLATPSSPPVGPPLVTPPPVAEPVRAPVTAASAAGTEGTLVTTPAGATVEPVAVGRDQRSDGVDLASASADTAEEITVAEITTTEITTMEITTVEIAAPDHAHDADRSSTAPGEVPGPRTTTTGPPGQPVTPGPPATPGPSVTATPSVNAGPAPRRVPARVGAAGGDRREGSRAETPPEPVAVAASASARIEGATAARRPPRSSDEGPAPAGSGEPVARASTTRSAPTPAPGNRAAGRPPAPVEPVPEARPDLTLAELASTVGLSPEATLDLQRFGLITPRVVGGTAYFDADALAIARAASAFAHHGVEARHLRSFKTSADREAGLLEQIVMPLIKQRNPRARQQALDTIEQLSTLGGELRAVLLRLAMQDVL